MLTSAKFVLVALVLPLVMLSCGGNRQTSSSNSQGTPDIYEYLRKPGKITHLRYTTYTPPWPTRTEAWIDWGNNRARSWNIQWTDAPMNPAICTSIRHGDDTYPCLPSLEKLGSEGTWWTNAFSPPIPLRASASELSLLRPETGASPDETAQPTWTPIRLQGAATTKRVSQGDLQVLVSSWKISSDFGEVCQDMETASADYEYTSTENGEPISEFIMVMCAGKGGAYRGVVYHDVQFLETSDLPSDFFDVASTRTSLIAEEMSSAAAQLGSVYWLGPTVGDWTLRSMEHDGDTARIAYSRGSGDGADEIELTTRTTSGHTHYCPNEQPLPAGSYPGFLCRFDSTAEAFRAIWEPMGFDVGLENPSILHELARDDILALAARIEPWDKKASQPMLTDEKAREFVADSLELVCPPALLPQIREARSGSSFNFDRQTGEWNGVFGAFGEFAVPDSKPVAIPIDNRDEIQSAHSHKAEQFLDCTFDSQR